MKPLLLLTSVHRCLQSQTLDPGCDLVSGQTADELKKVLVTSELFTLVDMKNETTFRKTCDLNRKLSCSNELGAAIERLFLQFRVAAPRTKIIHLDIHSFSCPKFPSTTTRRYPFNLERCYDFVVLAPYPTQICEPAMEILERLVTIARSHRFTAALVQGSQDNFLVMSTCERKATVSALLEINDDLEKSRRRVLVGEVIMTWLVGILEA